MKIIFRIALMTSLLLSFSNLNAQSVIIRGGLTISNMTIKDNFEVYSKDYKNKMGFHAGVSFDLPLFAGLSLEPGVQYSAKGFKVKMLNAETIKNLNYVDVPINLRYTLGLGIISVWGSVGPYLGVGINGKSTTEKTTNGKTNTLESDINFGDKELYKILDYGLGIGAGIELKGIILGAYYNVGMANLSNIDIGNHSVKNGVFNLTLGIRFGGN